MEIPKELIEKIADNSVTVFVGAGLSQGAGLPGWPNLLEQMKHRYRYPHRASL